MATQIADWTKTETGWAKGDYSLIRGQDRYFTIWYCGVKLETPQRRYGLQAAKDYADALAEGGVTELPPTTIVSDTEIQQQSEAATTELQETFAAVHQQSTGDEQSPDPPQTTMAESVQSVPDPILDTTAPTASKVASEESEEERIQALLDNLVYNHGSDPAKLPNYNLRANQVTQAMWNRAEQRAKKRLNRSVRGVTGSIELRHVAIGTRFTLPPPYTKKGRLVGLNDAEATVELDDGKRQGWSLATVVRVLGIESEGKGEIVKVDQKLAREMFEAMGSEEAMEWLPKRLAKNLNRLPELLEDLEKPKDKDLRSLFTRCMDALEDGGEIRLKGEEAEEEDSSKNGDAPKKKRGRPKGRGKASANGKASKRNHGDKEDLDDWGSPKGSSNAKVNSVLMKATKPLKFGAIVEKTGLGPKQVRYAHLNSLIAKKKIKKTDEGFVTK